MGAKNGIFIQCKSCNKDIYTCPSKNKKFCSYKCRAIIQNPIRAERAKNGKLIDCPICKKSIYVCPSTLKLNKHGLKYCSRKCKNESMKIGIAKWGFKKSGNKTSGNVYPRTQINNVRMKEHRRVMQEFLGRKLKSNEHVHHINEDPLDNRIENLKLLSPSEHAKIHHPKIF